MTEEETDSTSNARTQAAADQLREAWDGMLQDLAVARDAIDDPARMPPPATERILAEGYRYLMGFAHSAIERAFFEDPARPTFRHALQILNKGTIDNADAIYLMAPIDGRKSYLVTGKTNPRRKGPHYLIFEASDGCIAGDSGSLAELRPGVKARTGMIDSSSLIVDEDGSFEILVGPEKPADHQGNFLCSMRANARPHPDTPAGQDRDARIDRFACYLSGRQLFGDWENEDPVALTIRPLASEVVANEGVARETLLPETLLPETSAPEPVAHETPDHGAFAHGVPDQETRTQETRTQEMLPPPAFQPDHAAAALRRTGALVRGQMLFWNEFNTILLETHGKADGSDGERFMPRNALNQPNAASGATGGGQSTNIYAGGVFELEPDEALIVTARVNAQPDYMGFSMSNLWGESLDFANHQSSLNGLQAEQDADGAWRYVVAHADPGVPNWLDTTGHREGYLSPRWAFSTPPPKEEWPTIRAEKVPFDQIRDFLPAETRTVSREERERQIDIRRDHVQRRYRCF